MKIRLSDHFSYQKLMRFCFPPMMMVLFGSVYGVVDGLFVSNFVGKSSFTAINLVMPVNFILGGLGFMAGAGGSALVGKTLGEGKKELASGYFSMIFQFILAVSVFLALLTAAFMRPISLFLGAGEETLHDCVVYGTVLLLFNPAYILQMMFQNFLTTAEKPKLGLHVTVLSGVTNMVLDALFIAVFQWGVAGAALATGMSQTVGCLIPLIYFIRPNDSLLQLVKTKTDWQAIKKTCYNGMSELLSNVSGSVISIAYNFQLLKFAGEDGVAAYGVLMYIYYFFISAFLGYAVGVAPIVSFHYGAMNRKELKSLLRKSTVLMMTAGIAVMVLSQLLAVPMAEIFVGYDRNLMDMTVHGMRLFVFAFLFVGFNIFASAFFTALNNGVISAVLAFLRTFVFQLIPIQILPYVWGLDGIWSAVTISEMAAFLAAVYFIIVKRKRYGYL